MEKIFNIFSYAKDFKGFLKIDWIKFKVKPDKKIQSFKYKMSKIFCDFRNCFIAAFKHS